MTGRGPIVAGVAGAVIAGGLLWALADRLYLAPRAALEAEIEEAAGRVATAREQIADDDRVQAALAATADRTLGPDVETVDHRLRTRLNRIAEAVALDGATVGTGAVSARRSPARSAFPRRGAWRTLRDAVDFVEVEGWISGEGDLAHIVELVDRIDAEPWIKRITQVRIDPEDNGTRFAATVRLATLFLPGRAPDADAVGEPAYDRSRLVRLASLVQTNPFQLPEADPAPPPPPTTPPAPDPTFPWHEWMLTGVAEGPGGTEAWLRNVATGATRQLGPGGRIGEAALVRTSTEWAELEMDGKRFRVRVGGRLDDRRVVKDE